MSHSCFSESESEYSTVSVRQFDACFQTYRTGERRKTLSDIRGSLSDSSTPISKVTYPTFAAMPHRNKIMRDCQILSTFKFPPSNFRRLFAAQPFDSKTERTVFFVERSSERLIFGRIPNAGLRVTVFFPPFDNKRFVPSAAL